jgi:hypothetical protein
MVAREKSQEEKSPTNSVAKVSFSCTLILKKAETRNRKRRKTRKAVRLNIKVSYYVSLFSRGMRREMSFAAWPAPPRLSFDTQPVGPGSKQHMTVEKIAASNPEYTWYQTADEVTFEMPVRLQTEPRGFVCAVCRTQRRWGRRAMSRRCANHCSFALHCCASSPFVRRGATSPDCVAP